MTSRITSGSAPDLSVSDSRPQVNGAGKDRFLLIVTVGWFLVTFVRVQDILPFLKVFVLGMLSTLGVMAAVAMRAKEAPWSDIILRCMLILLFGVCTGVAYATNTFWLYTDFITLLNYLFVFMMAMPILAKNPYCLRILIKLVAGSAFVTAVWGMTHGGHGQGSWLGDENDVALWLNIGTPFCYFAARSAKTRLERYFLLTTAAFCAVATIASFSRGGFVGLVTGVFAIGLFSRKSLKVLTITALVGLAALPILASLHPPEHRGKSRPYLEELFSMNDKKDSTRMERIYTWTGGWVMYKANPIFGIGAGNYPYALPHYEDDPELRALNVFNRSFGGRQTHSSYFEMLAELGSVGAICFFIMWGAVFRRSWRLSQTPQTHPLGHIAAGVGAGLLAYSACCAFVSSFYYPPFWLLCGFACMMRLDLAREPTTQPAALPRRKNDSKAGIRTRPSRQRASRKPAVTDSAQIVAERAPRSAYYFPRYPSL
jgi:O-antigen ligase